MRDYTARPDSSSRAPLSGSSNGWYDLICKRADFFGHEWPDRNKHEMRHAGFGVGFDLVEAFLLAADHHLIADLPGRSLAEHRRRSHVLLFSFFVASVAEVDRDGFFDRLDVAPDLVAMTPHHVDQ